MKFNWGHGITLFLIVFVVFTASVVVLIITDDTYTHELVSEHYYEDELNYQKEIDKEKSAEKLSSKVFYRVSKEGVTLNFPKDFPYDKVGGLIKMRRPSKQLLDFDMTVKLDSTYKMLIPIDKAIAGKWNMVIDWEVGDQQFMYKAKIMI